MKQPIYDLMFAMEDSYWWYVARRRIIVDQIKAIVHNYPAAKGERLNILDYGCGTGSNLMQLQGLGDTYGLDVSRQAVAYCRQRGLTSVMHVDHAEEVAAQNPFGVPFDIITLLDVLEHVPDDVRALKRITNLLDHGGIVFVTVPAYDFLWSGEDYASEHLRRYDKSKLQNVFQAAGVSIERISYFNTLLFPFQAAVICWQRLFQPEAMYGSNVKRLPHWLNTCLTRIFSFETRLLQISGLPFGGSLVCWGRVNQQNEVC
jgi:2-polyprenyl-3-methyl-5-hydroxy-6-metoxy-1,4-benzoquinol methylase